MDCIAISFSIMYRLLDHVRFRPPGNPCYNVSYVADASEQRHNGHNSHLGFVLLGIVQLPYSLHEIVLDNSVPATSATSPPFLSSFVKLTYHPE